MIAQQSLPAKEVIPPSWSRYTNLIIDRGEGSWLVAGDGNRYLDYRIDSGRA